MLGRDDAIADLAVDLNEEAKARRRAKKAETPLAEEAEVTEAPVGDDTQTGTAAEPDGEEGDAGEQTGAIDRMERVASETELNVAQLVPTVRDFLVDQIKMRPKPWSATLEADKRGVYAAAEHAATELVRKIVEAIAAGGKSQPIRALVTKFNHGDKIVITAELKAFSEEETLAALIALHKAQGKHVLISASSVDDYRGNLGPSIEPDEAELDFAADGDESEE